MFRKVERLNDENDSLVQQVQAFQVDNKIAKEELANKDVKIKEMESKLSKLETKAQKCMELEASIICLKESEKAFKERNLKLDSALKAETEKLTSVEESLQMEKKLAGDKNNQIKMLSEQLAAAQANQTDDSLPDKISVLEQTIDTLKHDNNKNKETLEQLNIEIGHKDKTIREHQTTNEELISELNELNTELKKRGEKIANMEEDYNKTKESLKNLQAKTEEVQKLQAEQLEFEKKMSIKETEMASLKKVADSKQEVYVELADKEKELNDTLERLETVETDLQTTKVSLQLKDQEIERLRKLAESSVELTEALEKIDKYTADIEHSEKIIKDHESRINELEILNHESDQMIATQTKEISSLDDELANVRKNNEELKQKIKTLDQLFKEANNEYTTMLKTAEEKNETMQSELQLKEEETKSLNVKILEIENETKETTSQFEQSKQENITLQKEIAELRAQLENDNSEASEINSEGSDLKTQLEGLRNGYFNVFLFNKRLTFDRYINIKLCFYMIKILL